MPFCTICSVHFTGRGSYCTHHNPYLQTYYPASDTHGAKYRSSALTRYKHPHPPRKPLQLGSLEPYGSSNALALAGYDDPDWRPDVLRASTLKPLGHVFEKLSATHAITQLTYAVDVHGTQSLTATANPEREQCVCCGNFFADRGRLVGHWAEFPVRCDVHGVCLRWDDVEAHAEEERHERCFVRGCMSLYRRESGWKEVVVAGHVRDRHGLRGRSDGIWA